MGLQLSNYSETLLTLLLLFEKFGLKINKYSFRSFDFVSKYYFEENVKILLIKFKSYVYWTILDTFFFTVIYTFPSNVTYVLNHNWSRTCFKFCVCNGITFTKINAFGDDNLLKTRVKGFKEGTDAWKMNHAVINHSL